MRVFVALVPLASHWNLLAWFLLAALAGACRSSPNPNAIGCDPVLSTYDPVHLCRGEPQLADGLCISNAAVSAKGDYVLCALSPAGTMFLLNAVDTEQLQGSGWTFGPQTWAESIFKLPLISDEYEPACEKATANPIIEGIPGCGTEGGATDAPNAD
jgi:hypothetical protein